MKKVKSLLIKGGLILIALVALVAVFNPFSLNDAGNRQVIQHITGSDITNTNGEVIGSTILDVRFAPGLYFSGFFSTVTTWPNNVTVQVGSEKNISDEADYWTTPHSGTFAGGDKATLGHTVKWDLPNTKAEMIELHTTYGGIDNLMSTTLLQYQKETASYSCQRMESEAHYSGGQSQLKDYFQDQLRKGQVLLKTETKTRIQTDGTAEKYIEVEEKIDTLTGQYLRTTTDIQKYNLYASFVSIDMVDYDPRIMQKLKDKIDAASDESTSKQRLITAQQEEQEAIVKGRKLIAETTATEEASEQKEIIQARKLKLVAKEKLEEDKYKAASTIALKRAEAEGDRLKVAAGLTPLEKATIDKETKIGVAKALANRPVPKIVFGGSDNGSSSLTNSYTIDNMITLMNKIDKVK